jgi:tape measure domain-containing protein
MIAGSIEIQLLANLARLQSDMDKAQRTVGGAMKNINASVELAKRALGGLGAGFSTVQIVKALIAASDQFTKLNAQITIATRNQKEYNAAFSDITRIAKTAQSEIESISKLYARLNLSLRDANRSQREIATISETVALALKVNGATVAESASAMLQLSQAFGSGVLRGEEFRAVMESAPNLMRRLAESIGVPVGQLKVLAEEGRLTSDVLTKAFSDSKYLSMLREQADHVRNLGGAWQVFKNELILSIGEIDKAAGSSRFISALLGGAGMAVKETTGRGGNTTVPAVNPEDTLFGGLRRGLLFGGLSNIELGDTPEVVKKQKEAFDALAKSLNITSSEYEKLNELEKKAKKSLDDGAITAKQYAQIKEGITAERVKLSKSQLQADKKAIEVQQEYMRSVGDLAKEIYALGEPEKTQIELLQQQLELMPRIPEEIRASMQARIEHAKAIERENEWHQAVIESIEREIEQQAELEKALRAQDEARDAAMNRVAEEMLRREEDLNIALLMDDKKRVHAQLQLEYDRQEAYIRSLDDGTEATHSAVESMIADLKRVYGMEAYRVELEKHKKVWESIEKTAHDTFISIFDSGKSAFDRLRDTLKNGLYELLWQMVHTKWFIPIQTAVMGGASGSAMAGLLPGEIGGMPSGSGGFGFGSIKSIFDVVTKGFDAANNMFLQGISDFGANVANMGGIFEDIGGWIGKNNALLGDIAPFIPSVISLLSGDIKGGIASGIGAGIGMALGGPAGGAIGSALGSLVGGLFGGKKKPPQYGAQSFGTYSGGDVTGYAKNNGRSLGGDALKSMDSLTKGFVETLGAYTKAFGVEAKVNAMAYFRKRSTLRGNFGGDIDGQGFFIEEAYGKKTDISKGFDMFVNTVMGPMMVQAIQKSRLPAGIKALFDGMVDRTQVLNMINATMGLNASPEQLAERFGLTVDQAGRVSKATGKAGNDLIAFVNNLATAANSFKTVGDVLIEARDNLTASFSESGGGSSLPATLKAFDDILKGIDKTTQAGIKQFAELYAIRDNFNQYVQSLDSLKGGVKGALFGIVSPAEQQAMMQADLAQLFGSLNLQIPGSVQELINLGKSIDYTTEEGLNLAAAFPSLVQAFQQAREQTDALTNSLQSLDTSRFATLVDYTRAVRYAESGIDISRLPSYDVGTAFVPQDGPAMIHQGERIMTRSENAELVSAVQQSAAVAQGLARLEQKLEAGFYAVASATGDMAKRMRKWDGDGLPAERTV